MATEKTPLLNGEKTPLLTDSIITIPVSIDGVGLEFFDKTKGLSLEELMPFQDDPWWINLRKTFFLSFWLTLIVIFSTACILSIIQHGSCPVSTTITTEITNYIVRKQNVTTIIDNNIMTSAPAAIDNIILMTTEITNL